MTTATPTPAFPHCAASSERAPSQGRETSAPQTDQYDDGLVHAHDWASTARATR